MKSRQTDRQPLWNQYIPTTLLDINKNYILYILDKNQSVSEERLVLKLSKGRGTFVLLFGFDFHFHEMEKNDNNNNIFFYTILSILQMYLRPFLLGEVGSFATVLSTDVLAGVTGTHPIQCKKTYTGCIIKKSAVLNLYMSKISTFNIFFMNISSVSPACRKRRLKGAVSRNNRIKRMAPCRCLDGHVKEKREEIWRSRMTNTPKRQTMHRWNDTKTLQIRSITQLLWTDLEPCEMSMALGARP